MKSSNWIVVRRSLAVVLLATLAVSMSPPAPGLAAAPALPTDGIVTEYPLPPGFAGEGVATGPDGGIWATSLGALTGAGRFDLGTASFNMVTSQGGQTIEGFPEIAAGPDGNLWYTSTLYDLIVKLTPAGGVTTFVTDGGGSPLGIAAGPDGNLWFVYGNHTRVPKIERITPQGVITKFRSPVPLSGSIAAGPDGALWATADGWIVRMTTSGQFTEYPLATGWRGWAITSGPDGNMWFVETDLDLTNVRIGRLSLSGTLTEFDAPSGTHLGNIISGPDGNLWFSGYNIEKMTPSGSITEYPIPMPPPYGAGALTVGPDGNIWFLAYAGPTPVLGRITDQPLPLQTLSPTSGLPGSGVVATGSGFGAFESVRFTFIDSSGTNTSLGKITTDATGHFSATMTIPTTASTGRQRIKAKGQISGLVSTERFTVTMAG